MKNLFYVLFILPLLFSCGGNDSNEVKESNSDAQAFCDCVKNITKECESNMEELEAEFQKDKDRYDAFAEEARKICPDAEKYISRMN